MEDVRRIWIDTSQIALDFVRGPLIIARWSDESSLPHMTIGALVGHVLHSGILYLEESLDRSAPPDRPIRASTLFSMVPLDGDDDVNVDVREVARAQDTAGPLELIERATACRARLVGRLGEEPADRVLAMAASGYTVPCMLDEFLAARILELVVHLDDLMASLGDLDVDLPREAVAVACHLGIDICMRRHGPMPVMQALYRRDRNRLDALRPL